MGNEDPNTPARQDALMIHSQMVTGLLRLKTPASSSKVSRMAAPPWAIAPLLLPLTFIILNECQNVLGNKPS